MPSAIIENPSSNTRSIRVVLRPHTYRGALTADEQILDRYRDGGVQQALFRQASSLAQANGASHDGDVLAPGGVLVATVDHDVADIVAQQASLEAQGLIVVIEP